MGTRPAYAFVHPTGILKGLPFILLSPFGFSLSYRNADLKRSAFLHFDIHADPLTVGEGAAPKCPGTLPRLLRLGWGADG